jgi:hypothetical protein
MKKRPSANTRRSSTRRKLARQGRARPATKKANRNTGSPQRRSKPAVRRYTSRKTARRALDAVAKMRREKKSLTRAARSAHTTRQTVRKYAPGVVVRTARGRYKARGYDQLTRELRFLTPEGLIAIPVRGSASRSRIGEYFNAVHRYGETGDTNPLQPFRGRSISAKGSRYPFVIDPETLNRLLNAGEVSFEDIYPLTS